VWSGGRVGAARRGAAPTRLGSECAAAARYGARQRIPFVARRHAAIEPTRSTPVMSSPGLWAILTVSGGANGPLKLLRRFNVSVNRYADRPRGANTARQVRSALLQYTNPLDLLMHELAGHVNTRSRLRSSSTSISRPWLPSNESLGEVSWNTPFTTMFPGLELTRTRALVICSVVASVSSQASPIESPSRSR
jgi:hypothetical protein